MEFYVKFKLYRQFAHSIVSSIRLGWRAWRRL
jgi:hypothetical protein